MMDLLTFSDLELLRKRKAGVGTQNIPGANNSSLTQKRYLILTYAVEFDKYVNSYDCFTTSIFNLYSLLYEVYDYKVHLLHISYFASLEIGGH